MTEQHPTNRPATRSRSPAAPERVRTGVASVDEVIRAVEELEERPIEEHVGVFESAQVAAPPRARRSGDPQPDDHPGHT